MSMIVLIRPTNQEKRNVTGRQCLAVRSGRLIDVKTSSPTTLPRRDSFVHAHFHYLMAVLPSERLIKPGESNAGPGRRIRTVSHKVRRLDDIGLLEQSP
jgi:hypothetical protein